MADNNNSTDKGRLPPFSTFSNLLSPPESKPCDDFNSPDQAAVSEQGQESSAMRENTLAPIRHIKREGQTVRLVLPSPPISPYTRNLTHSGVGQGNEEMDESKMKDAQLFPEINYGALLAASEPLFPVELINPDHDALVNHHMHMNQFKNKKFRPTKEDYLLALSLVSVVSKECNRNSTAWLERERELTSRLGNPNRVTKPSAGPRKIAPAPAIASKKPKAPKGSNKAARASRAPRTPKVSPLSKSSHSFDGSPVNLPKQRGTGTSAKDEDYDALPNYAPPVSTLPNSTCLKAEWRGQPLDLSTDPDRPLLHEAELVLAAKLRLSCATYLCSKRRIFKARVQAYQTGKEFRKTDSQQACCIDVNKASKLWQAFDKVNWFDREWFEKYL
ncbi:MAG: hypothetical protein M1812_005285 [Candelaria pacifica]|nr:MAG: hypothetical protein M1812_005285 [Candelaria pacifica]